MNSKFIYKGFFKIYKSVRVCHIPRTLVTVLKSGHGGGGAPSQVPITPARSYQGPVVQGCMKTSANTLQVLTWFCGVIRAERELKLGSISMILRHVMRYFSKKLLCPSKQPVSSQETSARPYPSVTDPFKHSGSVWWNQRGLSLVTFIHKYKIQQLAFNTCLYLECCWIVAL